MRVADIKTTKRITAKDVKPLEIQAWDVRNNYPQKLLDAIAESGTAASCFDVYKSFLRGQGFPTQLADSIVNEKGQNLNDLLMLAANDIAYFGGIAIHVNYNLFYEITEVQVIPFEQTRLGLPKKEDSSQVVKIAVNKDWTGVKKKASKENTEYIHVYNPDPAVLQSEIDDAGGIANYKGQILWLTSDMDYQYPISIVDPVITDVNTEGGVATVKNRNVKNNFFPAGALIFDKYIGENKDNEDQDSREENEDTTYVDAVKDMQGDANACNVVVFTKEPGENPPAFVKFSGENYDTAFEKTETTVQANIAKRFKQPASLRCENYSNGFAADRMKDDYTYYNTVTKDERRLLERGFAKVLANYITPIDLSQIKITPSVYGGITN